MTDDLADAGTVAACHCGAVRLSLARRPTEVTLCNCSLCSRHGALWAYCPADEVALSPDPPPTITYVWNGRHVEFHHCRICACLTHWVPCDKSRAKRGVNARLLPLEVVAAARVRRQDGAGTCRFAEDLLCQDDSRGTGASQ